MGTLALNDEEGDCSAGSERDARPSEEHRGLLRLLYAVLVGFSSRRWNGSMAPYGKPCAEYSRARRLSSFPR